jgi:hypothetical protein
MAMWQAEWDFLRAQSLEHPILLIWVLRYCEMHSCYPSDCGEPPHYSSHRSAQHVRLVVQQQVTGNPLTEDGNGESTTL